jgi:hypothetical protein
MQKMSKGVLTLDNFHLPVDRPPTPEEIIQMRDHVVSASVDPPRAYLAKDVRPLIEKYLRIVQNPSSTQDEVNIANLEISKIESTRVIRLGHGFAYDDFRQQVNDVRAKLADEKQDNEESE